MSQARWTVRIRPNSRSQLQIEADEGPYWAACQEQAAIVCGIRANLLQVGGHGG